MSTVKKIAGYVFMYLVMIFTVVVSVLPLIWVMISSMKTNAAILSNPFSLPESFNLSGYQYIFRKYNFLLYTWNSLVASLSSTLLSLLFYAMAGYVFAKYRFPGKSLLYALFTITLLVPAQSKAQPIFSLIINLGLYDNIWGLALVYLSMGMAMSLFVLKNAFLSIPKSLDEAAAIDGAGFFRTFFVINLPLAKGGLLTAGILMFLNNWNEYFYASLLISSEAARTLPLALQFFNEALSYDYTNLFAALTVVVIPGILIYSLGQEKIQASIASAGIKG